MSRSDWILRRADAACGKVFHPNRQSAEGYRSTSYSVAIRLVHVILALYLIPAFLIVFLVGALGIMIVGVVRLFCLCEKSAFGQARSPEPDEELGERKYPGQ
ncbi:MAG: hypothetical protein ABSH35_36740 [Isosphaeraceae bacterium]|jgi:hypothetical protein